MQKYSFQSKNKEISIEKVLEELNVTEDEILTKSYEEKNGLFGKKHSLEVVKLKDMAEYGKNLLLELFNYMGKRTNIEVKIRDKVIKYEIITKDSVGLIGKRGHILDSIQTYIRQSIYTASDFYINIQIDIQGYKQKQNYFLEKKIKKLAREVTLSKGEIKLDPMNSYERKIVHSALQNFKYVKSVSEGEEPNRYVIIKYTENKED